MWAVDQKISLPFPNYESTLNREWLDQAVSRQRPATARLRDVGSTLTWATGLNTRQWSGSVKSVVDSVGLIVVGSTDTISAGLMRSFERTSCIAKLSELAAPY